MSLDVSLYRTVIISYDNGQTYTEEKQQVYESNITHNLADMAKESGLYFALWRPEEIKAKKASDIIRILQKGLIDLITRPEYFEQFNASNGWGTYKHFVPFVEQYLAACREYPDAEIEVSR